MEKNIFVIYYSLNYYPTQRLPLYYVDTEEKAKEILERLRKVEISYSYSFDKIEPYDFSYKINELQHKIEVCQNELEYYKNINNNRFA